MALGAGAGEPGGPHKAKEMLLLGRTYGLEALDAMGFFTETVGSDEELVPAAERLAAEVVRQPPVPTMVSKASINAQAMPLGRAIQHTDHVAVGFMGKSENSKTARMTYFSGEGRDWVDEKRVATDGPNRPRAARPLGAACRRRRSPCLCASGPPVWRRLEHSALTWPLRVTAAPPARGARGAQTRHAHGLPAARFPVSIAGTPAVSRYAARPQPS
ncbi:MAG: hypothetical protein R2749_18515 [Acidimicrobiales bacterium]